jgi:SpoVK/Ycf46/Vps4 family AAA+-type ATPase
MKDSIDAISAALNMGDGILGDVCNIRLVITTNQPVTEIDEAMKRPGRLSTSCVVGSLGKEEIEIAWKKLSGDKEMPFSLKGRDSASIAEVFQFNVEE